MKKAVVISSVKGYAFSFILIYLFYDSFYAAVLVSLPMCALYTAVSLKKIREEKKKKIDLEFKDALQSVSSALSSGYSLENALRESVKDLSMIYGSDSLLVPGFQEIIKKNELNVPVEKAFAEFSSETCVEDIENFSEIISTAKRSGGNIISISRDTADKISGKIEVTREIETMLSGKKMENRFMMVIPVFMILYLRLFSPGFLDVMYRTAGNRMIMTVLLVIYISAVFIGNKITDIEV